ncbi:hypothetical protein PAXINDRAFT_14917 [Paxillus involutus ATCC 200175]|uniref:NACHT domain-containing protein n=1 Tax=Paxillus involutus ATCC 200175 TaxID=664439 RepID=A0A0C9TXG6_PAXIN|nr:hypothetical protein PAXINDRAFT_14917 [Paxillus involutus ATCC 200175]
MDAAADAATIIQIAQATQQVLNAGLVYAKRYTNAEKSCKLLQYDLRCVLATANIAIDALTRCSSLGKDPNIDDRLVQWFSSDEPKKCLDMLKEMEGLITGPNRTQEVLAKIRFAIWGEDKIKDAIALFDKHRAYFHFLLSADTWNDIKDVKERQEVAEGLLKHIDGENKDIQEGVKTVANEIAEITEGVKTVATEIAEDREERKKEFDRDQVTGFLQWLDGLDCTTKHEATHSLRQPDTCTWLPKTEKYQSWKRGGKPFLWLGGKAGSGKSVLASAVIDDLQRGQIDEEVLAYFYCDFRDERSVNAHEVLRSLLAQLLRHAALDRVDCRDAVPDLVQRKEKGASPPNDINLLIPLVLSAAKLHQLPVIVVDALDECGDVEKLLDALKQLNDGHIRLFVTSRLEQAIRERFAGLPCIPLDAMGDAISADMKLHIIKELDGRPQFRILEAGLKTEIRSALLAGADGMFRWVQCQIDTLAECPSAGDVREALKSLPIGLDTTYQRILLAIDRRRVEIMEALRIDLGKSTLNNEMAPMHETNLLRACGSLVSHDEETGIVTLSHFSVKEYLTGELILTQLPRYHINWQGAHAQLARSCIHYLSLDLGYLGFVNDEGPIVIPSTATPFLSNARPLLLNYALTNGFEHLAHLGVGNELVFDNMKVLQADIQQHPSKWERIRTEFSLEYQFWSTHCSLHWSNLKLDFMFYILIRFAPALLLEKFLDHGSPMPKDGTNSLLYAASFGKPHHAWILLSRGTSADQEGLLADGSRRALPLTIAVELEHDELVDLFLVARSRVPQQLFDSAFSWNTPFPLRIIRKLLHTNEFVHWVFTHQDKFLLHETILRWGSAVEDNDILVDVLHRLVEVGEDPLVCNHNGQTPLCVATTVGHIPVVQYLLTFPILLPPHILFTAVTAWSHQAQMTSMLIDKGAGVHILNHNGDSLLHVIMHHLDGDNYLQVAKRLIDAGCNPSLCNSQGSTPLHIAVTGGHISIVESLLSLNIPLPDNILLTAVNAESHEVQMMCMLIDKGADVHILDSDGDGCKEACCDLLLHNLLGNTPLHIAVEEGHIFIVEYLLSLDIQLPHNILLTAVTAWSHEVQMMCMLIEKGADVHILDSDGDGLLHDIMLYNLDEGDCLQVAKRLIGAGCDPLLHNPLGSTPLNIAIKQGHISIVEYLLSLNIPLPHNALFTAVETKVHQAQMMQMLINKGANVHHVLGSTRSTVLHDIIAQHTSQSSTSLQNLLEVVKILVDSGSQPA